MLRNLGWVAKVYMGLESGKDAARSGEAHKKEIDNLAFSLQQNYHNYSILIVLSSHG